MSKVKRTTVGGKNIPSSRTVPSNRLSHGLSSRAISEARTQQVRALADVLLRDAPKTFEVLEAAFSLAGAMLHVAAVRRAKNALLTTGDVTLRGANHGSNNVASPDLATKTLTPEGRAADPGQKMAEEFVASVVEGVLRDPDNVKTFVRLYEYERKAISRRNKLMLRFDCAVFEAHRKQREAEAAAKGMKSPRRGQS